MKKSTRTRKQKQMKKRSTNMTTLEAIWIAHRCTTAIFAAKQDIDSDVIQELNAISAILKSKNTISVMAFLRLYALLMIMYYDLLDVSWKDTKAADQKEQQKRNDLRNKSEPDSAQTNTPAMADAPQPIAKIIPAMTTAPLSPAKPDPPQPRSSATPSTSAHEINTAWPSPTQQPPTNSRYREAKVETLTTSTTDKEASNPHTTLHDVPILQTAEKETEEIKNISAKISSIVLHDNAEIIPVMEILQHTQITISEDINMKTEGIEDSQKTAALLEDKGISTHYCPSSTELLLPPTSLGPGA